MKTIFKILAVVAILLSLAAVSKYKLKDIEGIAPTLTAAELNYLDGATSSIQTQLNAKVDIVNADTINFSLLPKQVAYSAVQHSYTGSTTETTVYTTTIPANSIGPNGSFHITGIVSAQNSGDVKYLKIRFNGTQVGLLQVPVSTTEGKGYWIIANRNSQSSQVAFNADASTSHGFTTNAAAISTLTLNTTAAITVTLTVTLENGTRSAAWEYVEILAIKGV